MIISKCQCGKRKSQYANHCRNCAKKRHDEHLATARAQVATGKCPTCGAPLRRNSSMAGWWQCAQLGNEQFRMDPARPSCSWQTFTE